nr:unnamed protein product [Callosobruchus analis]
MMKILQTYNMTFLIYFQVAAVSFLFAVANAGFIGAPVVAPVAHVPVAHVAPVAPVAVKAAVPVATSYASHVQYSGPAVPVVAAAPVIKAAPVIAAAPVIKTAPVFAAPAVVKSPIFLH